jgi:tellurite resistance protein TerA
MAINLEKITLEKQGDTHTINLTKGGSISSKEIVINLNWSQEAEKKGIFSSLFGGNKAIDLDLGCFYQLSDGQKTVIDGLQFAQNQGGPKDRLTRQGRYTGIPWIWHTGDDRGTAAGSGENILVNPAGINDLKRIIIYTFIYEGAAKWAETNAVVTLKVANNPDIVVEMGKQYSSQKFCAIAEILFDSQSNITVKKLITFHDGHGECDKAYKWGMTWQAGSK